MTLDSSAPRTGAIPITHPAEPAYAREQSDERRSGTEQLIADIQAKINVVSRCAFDPESRRALEELHELIDSIKRATRTVAAKQPGLGV